MNHKVLNIDFRYLGGNIACLSVDSVTGKNVHNDIDNDEAIIIFNSLVGEKENCITVKSLQQENKQLNEKLQQSEEVIKEIKALIENHNNLERELQGTIKFNLVKLSNILNKYKKEESE